MAGSGTPVEQRDELLEFVDGGIRHRLVIGGGDLIGGLKFGGRLFLEILLVGRVRK